MTSGIARRANALVTGSVVDASGSVLADAGGASVEFVLTAHTDVIVIAAAVQPRTEVTALAVVHARVADAAVGCRFAAFAIRTGRTGTEEVSEQVDAVGVVQARLIVAEAHVDLATLTRPSSRTRAFEVVDEFGADASVKTRRRLALVDVRLAQIARETWTALAPVFINLVEAAVGAHRVAGVVQALVDVNFALDAEETRAALAHEAFEAVGAAAAVTARLGGAVVDLVLTCFTGETLGALARKVVL